MEENIILVLEYDRICRFCLNSKGCMSEIFENREDPSLQLQILRVTSFKVEDGNGLPTRICHKCRYIIEMAYDFQDVALRSQKILLQANNGCDAETPIAQLNYKHELEDTKEEKTVENGSEPELNEEQYHYEEYHVEPYHSNNEDTENCDQVQSEFCAHDKEEVNNIADLSNSQEEMGYYSSESTQKTAPKHLTCQICLLPFATIHQVETHTQSHYVESSLTPYYQMKRPFSCEECNLTMSKKQMIVHHREHLGVNPFRCKRPGCEYVAKNLASYRVHANVHASRTQICEYCGAAFKRRSDLKEHRSRMHAAVRPLVCTICNIQCRNEIAYRIHLTKHDKLRRFKCGVPGCTKSYIYRSEASAHERSHRREREHRCELCAAAYCSRSLLNRHLRAHSRRAYLTLRAESARDALIPAGSTSATDKQAEALGDGTLCIKMH